MNDTLKKAFITTIPVLLGYLSIGVAFGLMIHSIGYNVLWAGIMSLTIYAGTMQYIAVDLIKNFTTYLNIAVVSLLVNFRQLVYGLSMIDKFKNYKLIKKFYMIFSLTDETYALISSTEVPESVIKEGETDKYYFYIAILDHSYWIIGSIIGATIGSLIKFNTEGISFAMVALFCVICTEQWLKDKNAKLPSIIGGACGIVSLLIFGPDNMMIPAIIAIIVFLLLINKREGRLN